MTFESFVPLFLICELGTEGLLTSLLSNVSILSFSTLSVFAFYSPTRYSG